MPSPQRLFRNFTTDQINQLIASGFDRMLNGSFTSLSGGGKSSSNQQFDLETLLREANAELDERNGTPRAARVEQRLFQ